MASGRATTRRSFAPPEGVEAMLSAPPTAVPGAPAPSPVMSGPNGTLVDLVAILGRGRKQGPPPTAYRFGAFAGRDPQGGLVSQPARAMAAPARMAPPTTPMPAPMRPAPVQARVAPPPVAAGCGPGG